MKNIILIVILMSLVLSSLFARAQQNTQVFASECSNVSQPSTVGYNSSSRLAMLSGSRVELVTRFYKQVGCQEIVRVNYSVGEIRNSMKTPANASTAQMDSKYLIIEDTPNSDSPKPSGVRDVRPGEGPALSSQMRGVFSEFKGNSRMYVSPLRFEQDRTATLRFVGDSMDLQVQTASETTILKRQKQ